MRLLILAALVAVAAGCASKQYQWEKAGATQDDFHRDRGSPSARTERIMERAIKSKLRYTASDFISIQKEIKESLSRVQEFQAALAIPLHQRYFATHSTGSSSQ